MTTIPILLQGLILGFSIAAPVGPIGVLCIRRTLADGRWAGFLSGMGAATADAIYGAMAAFGLATVTNLLVSQQLWLRLVGGLFLCYLGIRTLRSQPAERPANASGGGLLGAYLSTFVLTVSNPMTILSFVAMFAGIASVGQGYEDASLMVAGVFLGSALWWLILAGIVGFLRQRFTQSAMRWVNWLSGAIVLGFGLVILIGSMGD